MFELVVMVLLGAGALLFNAHAARIADRTSARRARLEQRWRAMIAAGREAA